MTSTKLMLYLKNTTIFGGGILGHHYGSKIILDQQTAIAEALREEQKEAQSAEIFDNIKSIQNQISEFISSFMKQNHYIMTYINNISSKKESGITELQHTTIKENVEQLKDYNAKIENTDNITVSLLEHCSNRLIDVITKVSKILDNINKKNFLPD